MKRCVCYFHWTGGSAFARPNGPWPIAPSGVINLDDGQLGAVGHRAIAVMCITAGLKSNFLFIF